jgi:pimeloyl-ACP methyl ester carboxylesterase
MPFCNPFAKPRDGEQFGCPGVPFQQASNFIYGTRDALSFFLSTPRKPYRSRNADTPVNRFNPLWRLFNRKRDKRSVTRGRRTRVAIVGHSLGAFAVSYVQGVDKRVEAVVALDKLTSKSQPGIATLPPFKPKVPALALQSEYGFNVQPYWANQQSSLKPAPGDPSKAPPPKREQATGFDAWRKAHVDSMVIVPRASTHLEYTDIAYALPASRYGQDLASVYVQRWLDRYLKHRSRRPLFAKRFRYLEPVAVGKWAPKTLVRRSRLSFYFCSGYSVRGKRANLDLSGVGGCSR